MKRGRKRIRNLINGRRIAAKNVSLLGNQYLRLRNVWFIKFVSLPPQKLVGDLVNVEGPKLGLIAIGNNPEVGLFNEKSIMRMKELRFRSQQIIFDDQVTKEEIIKGIDFMNRDDSIHGILLYMPFPLHLKADQQEILNSLDPFKDIDSLGSTNYSKMFVWYFVTDVE